MSHVTLQMTGIAPDTLVRLSNRLRELTGAELAEVCLERYELLILMNLIPLPDGETLAFSSLFGPLERYRVIAPNEDWLKDLHSQCVFADQAWNAVGELLNSPR